jgi:group I intron endonuclease
LKIKYIVEKNMGYIYKITNTKNKKCYIGVTTKNNPNERWYGHKNAIKNGRGCPLLRNAFTKHGEDSFKFEVLIICFDTDLYIYEKEYIKKYNSMTPNGYNAHEGGEFGGNFLGKKHTEEVKEKMRLKLIEYNKSEEVREKARQRLINFNKTHNIGELQRKSEKWQKALREGRIGGGQSDEVKNKIRESVKRYFENNGSSINKEKHSQIMTKINGRKVNQYNKDKVFIASYDSIVLASNASGIGRHSIQSNTSGRTKSAGGYIWEYADKELKD